MYLNNANKKAAGDFLNGVLWKDLKRCLEERRPPHPDAKDDIHVAAAKGHKRAGFEEAVAAIEKLPFEYSQDQENPFSRPAVSITED